MTAAPGPPAATGGGAGRAAGGPDAGTGSGGLRDSLGPWGAYFVAKAYLFFRGYLRAGFAWNAAFLVFLLLPMPERLAGKRHWRVLRQALNAVLAALLLWSDSWLPPIAYAVQFFSAYDLPTPAYAAGFLARTFVGWNALAAAVLAAGYLWLRRRLFLTPLVAGLLLFTAVWNLGGKPKEPIDTLLDRFFSAEAGRSVSLAQGAAAAVPDFDVVIVHVCSVSWDDLAEAGSQDHPFLKGFDVLFRRFNSVTSHSTPSALRLHRALCGQPRHADLYRAAAPACYLFDGLRAAGYSVASAMDHDGRYGDMAGFLARLGRTGERLETTDLPARQINFDGRPIFDDYQVLERWWSARLAGGAPRAALYFNTVALHGGSRDAGEKGWWKRDRGERYRAAFDRLARDLERFYALVEASGRRLAVFFVPEHGMGLRGSAIQANDLRELPLPYITVAPAGLKLLAPERRGRGGPPVEVRGPASHLAWAHLLSRLLAEDLFAADRAALRAAAGSAPGTAYVAENENARVTLKDGIYYLFDKEGRWRAMPADVEVRH